MTSIDIYAAAKTIDEALSGLSETEIKKAMLMALIATDKEGILVDPVSISLNTAVYVPRCDMDDDDDDNDKEA